MNEENIWSGLTNDDVDQLMWLVWADNVLTKNNKNNEKGKEQHNGTVQ